MRITLIEGSPHDAIIEPAEWQLVQTEIQRRKNTGRSHNCCSPFSAKLKCGDCGEYFGSKVWIPTSCSIGLWIMQRSIRASI